MKFPLLLVLGIIPLVGSCGCGSKAAKEFLKLPPSRESSAKLALPPGGHWSSAVVVTESGSYEHTYGGRGGFGSTTYYYARVALVLAKVGGGEDRVTLASGYEGGSADEALAGANRKWRLATPSDGHGIACLGDGGDGWLWVSCDSPRPFHCPHLRVGSPGDADPCANGPRWREFVVEMMAPPNPKNLHPDGPDPAEWNEIAALVGRDPYNEVLLDSISKAALREHSGLVLAGVEAEALLGIQWAVASGQHASSGDPLPVGVARQVRSAACAILNAKSSAGSVAASNAAVLLGKSIDPDSQSAMANALLSVDWAPPATVLRDPQWPRAVAWSLASSALACYFVPEDVEATMIAFLKRADDKPESALPILFALATHGSPKARELVEAMGKESEDPAPPAWPSSLDELWKVAIEDHGALTHGLAAWAKAASAQK